MSGLVMELSCCTHPGIKPFPEIRGAFQGRSIGNVPGNVLKNGPWNSNGSWENVFVFDASEVGQSQGIDLTLHLHFACFDACTMQLQG